jgi:hypothetical protein
MFSSKTAQYQKKSTFVATAVTVVCVVISVIDKTEAVKCYVCSSQVNSGCNEKSFSSSGIATTANCAYCGKSVAAALTTRTCAQDCAEAESPALSKYCCTEDLCNRAAPKTTISYLPYWCIMAVCLAVVGRMWQ